MVPARGGEEERRAAASGNALVIKERSKRRFRMKLMTKRQKKTKQINDSNLIESFNMKYFDLSKQNACYAHEQSLRGGLLLSPLGVCTLVLRPCKEGKKNEICAAINCFMLYLFLLFIILFIII